MGTPAVHEAMDGERRAECNAVVVCKSVSGYPNATCGLVQRFNAAVGSPYN